MKIKMLFIGLFFLLSMCFAQNSLQFTNQEKENIEKELHDIVENLLRNFEQGNMDLALERYLHSDEFKSVAFDGSIVGFQKLKIDNEEVLKTYLTVKFITQSEDYNFLTNEIVHYLWSGKIEMTTDKGETWKFDPETVTLIFKKINNQWKAIFQHESALPPVKKDTDQTKM